MILVDSHCHLNLLKNVDLDKVIARAIANNVEYMQTVCTRLQDLPKLIALTEKYKNVFTSVGVHPEEVSTPVTSDELIKLSRHDKVIGLGETGLDYYHKSFEPKIQKQAFLQHIIAAQQTNLPIIVHTREAEADTADLLKNEMKNKSFKGLIHCFTASKEFAHAMLDIGFYISIAGIVTFKNASALQEVARSVPIDRLLIETDSPYLAPSPYRGKPNEPSYVKSIASFIADLRGESLENIARNTSQNFFTLFAKAKIFIDNNLV